jgi:WD40 repeat protein
MHVDDDGGLGEYTSLTAVTDSNDNQTLVATTVDRTLVVLQRDASSSSASTSAKQQQRRQHGDNSSGLRRSRAIVGDNDAISDVSYVDGVRLAVACNSALVRLVDLRTLQCTLLAGHTDTVLAVACSADGRRLATSGKDGTVRVYQLFRDTDVKRVCSAVVVCGDGGRGGGGGGGCGRLWHQSSRKFH